MSASLASRYCVVGHSEIDHKGTPVGRGRVGLRATPAGQNGAIRSNNAIIRTGGPSGAAVASERLAESSLHELSELRCRLELRNRLQLFECRRERVGETPDRSRSEFLIPRLEVQIMHSASKVLWSFQLPFDE